jgi:hypothetical protein
LDDWPAIVVQLLAVFVQLLRAVVTRCAKGLQLTGKERHPVTAMGLNVVGDGRRRCHASIEAEAAEWFPAELSPTKPAPAFQLIPATPVLIEPRRWAFSSSFPCWMWVQGGVAK